MNDTIDLLAVDIPDELPLHSKLICAEWLMRAHAAARKGDAYEAMRLVGLVKAKVADEMARTRCCEH